MTDVRIEGIRKTNAGTWAVVGSRRGESVVPERSPRVLTLVSDHAGPGAKAAAIRAAGTNRVVPGCGGCNGNIDGDPHALNCEVTA